MTGFLRPTSRMTFDLRVWTITQKLCLVAGVIFLAHSIGGLVVNPDFAVGDEATAEVWLWMDWNGWHALSGIVLWTTAIAASPRADLSRLFAVLVVATQVPLVTWMIIDSRPLGLFLLPTTADIIFHSVTAVMFGLAVVMERARREVSGQS